MTKEERLERDLIILQMFLKGKKRIDIARMVFGSIEQREHVNQIIKRTIVLILRESSDNPDVKKLVSKLLRKHR